MWIFVFFLILFVSAVILAGVVGVAVMKTSRKQIDAQNNYQMVQAELERQRQIYAQNNYVAAQAAEQQKNLAWVCASCGANNYNREVCEFCGAGKPN